MDNPLKWTEKKLAEHQQKEWSCDPKDGPLIMGVAQQMREMPLDEYRQYAYKRYLNELRNF